VAEVSAEAFKPLAKAQKRLDTSRRLDQATDRAIRKVAKKAAVAAAAATIDIAADALIAPTTAPAEGWSETFLKMYAQTGSKSKAARAAGVGLKFVKRREQEDEAFAEGLVMAKQVWVEHLESLLYSQAKDKNNALAGLALLKRWAPELYEDKLRIEGQLKHKIEQPPLPQAEIDAILRDMVRSHVELMQPEERRRLLAGDGPPALVEAIRDRPDVVDADFVDVIRTEPVQPAAPPALDEQMAALSARFGAPAGGQR